MKEFKIINIKDFEYELVDDNNKSYKISMVFYELKQKPKINSRVFLSSQLLDKSYYEYSDCYYFGKVGSIYGRNPDSKSYEIDIIEIELDGEKVRLQRHYG